MDRGKWTNTLARPLRLLGGERPVPAYEHVPTPPPERGPWLLAGGVAALGTAALLAALTGLIGGAGGAASPPPPPVLFSAPTPTPASATASGALAQGPAATGARGAAAAGAQGTAARGSAAASASRGSTAAPGATVRGAGAIVASPSAGSGPAAPADLEDALQTPIPARWIAGFYPIYAVAQSTFGVNWLLIASIHEQETAFSTAPSTYHGLNFAGCCGGPMQFNVTNGSAGSPSTWDLVKDSYRYGARPAAYDHPTARHPSIYDDFDAIMAAAHLLSADNAALALDQNAWDAAYDYYGPSSAGVTYADQVLARAIGWSQHGFCADCATEPALLAAVHAAYGAPILAALQAAQTREAQQRSAAQAQRPTRRDGKQRH